MASNRELEGQRASPALKNTALPGEMRGRNAFAAGGKNKKKPADFKSAGQCFQVVISRPSLFQLLYHNPHCTFHPCPE